MKNSNTENKSLCIIHYPLRLLFLASFYILFTFTSEVRADPATLTAIAISLAISAATAGATYLVSSLTAPKPKPQDRNKLQGEIQISNTGEDLFINELVGARGADGFGGSPPVGVIFIYASDIREVITETTASSGGGGGKGVGGRKQTTKNHAYYIDLACLVSTGSRQQILEIKAGTDVLYRNYAQNTGSQINQTVYEVEAATLTGAATVVQDSTFSGGAGLKLDLNGTATFTVSGDGNARAVYIFYKAAGDKSLDATIGGVAQTVTLPDSFGETASVIITAQLASGATTVYLHSPVNGVFIDRITIGEVFSDPGINPGIDPVFGGISGTIDPGYINPYPIYSNNDLPYPNGQDWRPLREYNYQGNVNSRGELAAELPAGSQLRIYDGGDTQLPDPLLQTYFETKYGAGATPAYRNRTYFVLENFEITKYGSVPNITARSESLEIRSLGELYRNRSLRAGLLDSEIDFSALDAVPLRGYAITQRQAPKTEIEILNRILDVGVIENSDGTIEGVVPPDEVSARIPLADLDVKEDGEDQTKPVAIQTVVRNEYEIAKRLDLSYFDPSKNFEIGQASATREVTVSEKRENIETSLVLTENEARKIADRLHQKEWAEKDAESFTTFYNYSWLQPLDIVEVEDLEGNFNPVRILSKNGSIPGKLQIAGVSRHLPEPFPRIFSQASNAAHRPPTISIPGNVVGTLFDAAVLRSSESVPGVYAACVLTDQSYKFSGAALYQEKQTGFQLLETFDKQATFGKTLTSSGGLLVDVPSGWAAGDWDTVSTLTFDLYFGEVETRTDAEVLDKANVMIIGNEVIAFQTATRVAGFPNRWRISRLRRRLKSVKRIAHVSGERVLLLTDAVKYISLDFSEFGKTRNYKFVASGANLDSASQIAFTWAGATGYNSAIYATVDSNVPAVTLAPAVTNENGTLVVYIKRPAAFGYSANVAEVRIRKTSDLSLIKQADIGNTLIYRVLAPAVDTLVDYRWRNSYRLNNSDGWSAWSAAAATTAGSVPSDTGTTTTGGGDAGNPGEIQPVGGGYHKTDPNDLLV